MKLLTCILPLLLLEFILLVSSQSLSDAMSDLYGFNKNEESRASAYLFQQKSDIATKILKQVSWEFIPALTSLSNEIKSHIQNVADRASSYGYDAGECVSSISGALVSVEDYTLEVRQDQTQYVNIIDNITSASSYYITNVISKEVSFISSDFTRCMGSEAPQYCNSTLLERIKSKREQIPGLYDRELARNRVALTQIAVSYDMKVQEYLQEFMSAAKSHLAKFESCVLSILSTY